MNTTVRVLGAFVDTLVLNIYQTRADFQVIKGRLDGKSIPWLDLVFLPLRQVFVPRIDRGGRYENRFRIQLLCSPIAVKTIRRRRLQRN